MLLSWFILKVIKFFVVMYFHQQIDAAHHWAILINVNQWKQVQHPFGGQNTQHVVIICACQWCQMMHVIPDSSQRERLTQMPFVVSRSGVLSWTTFPVFLKMSPETRIKVAKNISSAKVMSSHQVLKKARVFNKQENVFLDKNYARIAGTVRIWKPD